jgi:anti-sigma factor RsiW
VDGGSSAEETGAVEEHLGGCLECARRARELRASLDALSSLPRYETDGAIAQLVRLRLDIETRKPGLATLLRSALSARPLILRSLVQAALVIFAVLGGILAINRATVGTNAVAWGVEAPSGTEGNPLFPSEGVGMPRAASEAGRAAALSGAGVGEGSLFVETVVARDGTVSAIRVIEGDATDAGDLLAALRRERFVPVKVGGRPVAVSFYRLLSRMDVRS